MSVSSPANPPRPSLWTVRGSRTAELRTPCEASSSARVTDRLRPATGPSVGNASASVEVRPGRKGVPATVTSGRSVPTRASPSVASAAASSAMPWARASGELKSLLKARWMTPSARSAPARSTARSASAPLSTSAPVALACAAEASERARAVTECPAESSSATTAEPMRPVPPVMKTRMTSSKK